MFGKFNMTIEIRGPVFCKGRLTEDYVFTTDIEINYYVLNEIYIFCLN